MNQYNKVMEIVRQNYGILFSKDLESWGFSKAILKEMVEKKLLIKECKGLYTLADEMIDEYALFQARCPQGIFSHGTALFFHGLSDRVPNQISITVAQGTNVSRLKKQSERLRFYYVKKEFLELGCMQGISPQGAEVRYYDKERCICDIIRHKKEIDMQIFTQAMKVYFANKDKNLRKLLKYSEQLGIREKVKDYVEVLA